MKYRNGKCYDDFGREMSQAQINTMVRESQEYLKQVSCPMSIKLNVSKELTKEDIRDKLSKNFKVS